MTNRNILGLGVAACALLLAGCQKEATGQVVAVVNGEEITMREINAELEQAKVPQNVDKKAVQQAILQRIIERRLLAQDAREEGLDKDPEFQLRLQQAEEVMLVQEMGKKARRASQVPAAKAVDKYIAENPSMFAQRTLYAVDRIQFAMPSDPSILKQFEPDHSMEAVAARLDSLNIKYGRQPDRMDSAMVPKPLLDRIRSLPAGEPFVVPENGMITVAAITGSRPAPQDPEQARAFAIEAMRNTELAETLQNRLTSVKAKAKIEYQPGFAPPAPKAGADKAGKPN